MGIFDEIKLWSQMGRKAQLWIGGNSFPALKWILKNNKVFTGSMVKTQTLFRGINLSEKTIKLIITKKKKLHPKKFASWTPNIKVGKAFISSGLSGFLFKKVIQSRKISFDIVPYVKKSIETKKEFKKQLLEMGMNKLEVDFRLRDAAVDGGLENLAFSEKEVIVSLSDTDLKLNDIELIQIEGKTMTVPQYKKKFIDENN